MTQTWRQVIEKAGGINAAFMYGEPLKQLVAEVTDPNPALEQAAAAVTAERERADQATARANDARSALELERAELNRRIADQEPLLARLKELERKVQVYEWYEPNLARVATEAWARAHPEEVTA